MKRLTLTGFKRDIKLAGNENKRHLLPFEFENTSTKKNTFVQRSILLQEEEAFLCWTTKHKKRGCKALDEVLEVLLSVQSATVHTLNT